MSTAAEQLQGLGFAVEDRDGILLVAGRVHYMPRSDRWIDQITSEGGRGLTRMVAFLRRITA